MPQRDASAAESRVSERSIQGEACSPDNEGRSHEYLDIAASTAEYADLPTRLEDVPRCVRRVLALGAFEHKAPHARQPTVWIPRDHLGVSSWEADQTMRATHHVSISNQGAFLGKDGCVSFDSFPPGVMEYDRVEL
ncbi:hypothetical protein FALBO_16792 [Fusarium albosuccineum]|uniref:10TM putative phosphate transporter extracellular tail domain-containing protein n=1 Tax=Fusarium albosuccineum TaxID=1237068 RepID=A0A8H4NUT7_9HYPO|nr:hypothetical protein FALBO_16792 [Fusarium albosuccineum]